MISSDLTVWTFQQFIGSNNFCKFLINSGPRKRELIPVGQKLSVYGNTFVDFKDKFFHAHKLNIRIQNCAELSFAEAFPFALWVFFTSFLKSYPSDLFVLKGKFFKQWLSFNQIKQCHCFGLSLCLTSNWVRTKINVSSNRVIKI